MDEKDRQARVESEKRRVLEIIRNRKELPKQQWWLSFADECGFRGVVISHGNEFMEALMDTNLHGCNPGGEVQGIPVPTNVTLPPEWTYRILTKEEANKLDNLVAHFMAERATVIMVPNDVKVCDFCVQPLPKNKPFHIVKAKQSNMERLCCIVCDGYIKRKDWNGLMRQHIRKAVEGGNLPPILPVMLGHIFQLMEVWSTVFGEPINIQPEDVLSPPKPFTIRPGSA